MTCGSVYEQVFNQSIGHVSDNYDRQVAKLYTNIYQEGWLACLTELGIPLKHLAWTKEALEVVLSNSIEPY